VSVKEVEVEIEAHAERVHARAAWDEEPCAGVRPIQMGQAK
jgi:hypothetical protein